MKIGICDDNREWRELARQIIASYLKKNKYEENIILFSDGRELLAESNYDIQILFLDIKMHGSNGITVASEVNRICPECQIVYMTNYLYYATEVYETEHAYFVLKEQFEEKIDRIMEKVLHALEQKEEKLTFDVIGGEKIVLKPQDIICFEREKRITHIETKHGVFDIWDKIDDVIIRLPDLDFARCHNSCIVYFPAVRELLKDHFIMNNGKKVLISRAYRKSTKIAFLKWARTQTS
ncbi:MAG: LytTR family DNA-binding domain-containing protein [Lachnospiraceae bacterium]|nr:LytTR family DNA-binding domain-containing protein [Lachnospiraceae bacterium]MDD3616922.1 LytTR family DNA-binding domain-containing protein [Lachnospiraceae bacterium]